MLMEHFDELVTDPEVHLHEIQQYLANADYSRPFLNRYQILVTSGTSGRPGIFLSSGIEGMVAAHTLTRFQIWGGVTARSKVAMMSSPLAVHITSRFPIMIDGQQVPMLRLSSLLPQEELIQHLNEWQPDVLFAYPLNLAMLADQQLQGRLHITPRSLGCTGETVTNTMRQHVEGVWQAKLFNMYALTECAVLAGECPSQGLHLFEDFSILEIVDQNNQLVPPGEQGEKVLLTVLYRRTQPLIRYEVTDLVRANSEPCPCGRPFTRLAAIQGKVGEVLYFQSLAGNEVEVSTHHLVTIFDTLPISGWQIKQEHDGLHVFLVGAQAELDEERLIDSLRQLLASHGIPIPPIEIQQVAMLTRNEAGKTPRLLSRLPRRTS
jgi:phenylacetate-coenzyme A ligase PaaK-like adenylate-forming protein